jgi:hypothetical protein
MDNLSRVNHLDILSSSAYYGWLWSRFAGQLAGKQVKQ